MKVGYTLVRKVTQSRTSEAGTENNSELHLTGYR